MQKTVIGESFFNYLVYLPKNYSESKKYPLVIYLHGAGERANNDDAKRKVVESQIPMGRFGTPEDCVGAVLMLCSEQGSYITGIDIIIDGGMRL